MTIHLRTHTEANGDVLDYSWYCSRWCYVDSFTDYPASDTFEQGGAYPCGAEHDAPDYCATCDAAIGNSLTDDGVSYVLDHLRDWPSDKAAELVSVYGLEAEARASEYRRIRAEYSYPAKHAWHYAAQFVSELPTRHVLDWNERGDKLTATLDDVSGFRVVVEVSPDYDAETDGTFTDTASADTVPIPERYVERGSYRYFVPLNTYRDHRDGLSKLGHSRGNADKLAREYTRRDTLNACREDRAVYVIGARAFRADVELGSAGIYGYELDPDAGYSETMRSMTDAVHDLGVIDEAVSEARAKLAELRASVHVVGSGDEHRLTD